MRGPHRIEQRVSFDLQPLNQARGGAAALRLPLAGRGDSLFFLPVCFCPAAPYESLQNLCATNHAPLSLFTIPSSSITFASTFLYPFHISLLYYPSGPRPRKKHIATPRRREIAGILRHSQILSRSMTSRLKHSKASSTTSTVKSVQRAWDLFWKT